MPNSVKTPVKNPFLIDLDGEIITLPGRSLEAMLGMFAHLESLSLRRSRGPSLILGGTDSKRTASSLPKRQPFEEGTRERISFRELGRQVIRAAQSQVRMLQARNEQIQSLVLINSWQVAEQLWMELLTDCKTPLYELNFLEELWGICPDKSLPGGCSLIRHWQQFVLLQAEIEVLLARRQSLVQLSDTLESHLGRWLKQFGELLDKLDEKSQA